jgi:hypothetical protein
MLSLAFPLLQPSGLKLTIRSCRSLHVTSRSHRNVLARYAVPANWPASIKTSLNSYETSSTEPVTTSVQAVPDPKALGSRNEVPVTSKALTDELKQTATEVPAMKAANEQVEPVDKSKRSAPMLVAGVWIPVKPRPPGEEGGCIRAIGVQLKVTNRFTAPFKECCMSGCVVSSSPRDHKLKASSCQTSPLLELRLYHLHRRSPRIQ